ncbi:trypsin-like serine peptidase [Singulisphaera acidiphila]|nr:serine protease [Singulisphaera acidiphila]
MKSASTETINLALRHASKGTGTILRLKDVPDPGQPAQPGTKGLLSLDTPPSQLEQLIGPHNNFLPGYFLEVGARMLNPVARVTFVRSHVVTLPDGQSTTFAPTDGWGTGFLVSRTLFLTNNHVIPTKEFAKKVGVWFNFQVDAKGLPTTVDQFDCDPDSFFHTNVALDFTLIRLKPKAAASAASVPSGTPSTNPLVSAGEIWGIVPINNSPDFILSQAVNIIQHPKGGFKQVAIQENELVAVYDNVIRYKSDTEPGSSGSPLFDNFWNLVGLHHASGDVEGDEFVDNEGIRIDRIVDDLRKVHGETDAGRAILAELGL